ncbi:hypothetical protein ARHIZOSPH14_26050 [Agromyces rhizosphaerae]|uniref:Uncharacterized protein n=1 Tax=Agromyces rhizosphaerae TaxID=88374 RepID=A0A9W6CTT9_9MICO|nr:hypothetical protein [Agromyces rhizosphaerae]GLI28363.1 hypothetical protein ARHIZOSPH14_26050 [Agromyces rhizosphaerae]
MSRAMHALSGAGAAALVASAIAFAAPAQAAEVVIDQPADGAGFEMICGVLDLAQTFEATATGDVTELELHPTTSGTVSLAFFASAVFPVGPEGYPDDPLVPAQQVDLTGGETATVTLDTPVPVTAGDEYWFTLRCAGDLPPSGTITLGGSTTGDPYPGGDVYFDEGGGFGKIVLPPGHADLAFRLVIDTDLDADGVLADADACSGTDASAPPPDLKRNHYWSTPDGFVDQTGAVAYSFDDTSGCSAEQIIDEAGASVGHAKHGLPRGVLQAWMARH